MTKERLDVLVAERGLAESREQAQRLIQAGQVMVKDQLATKPGHKFDVDAEIQVKAQARFVSRGGEKLDAAMENFQLKVEGLVCLDVGASTGGFTDCLLQRGARLVYAVDVGKGQLHWNLRNDPRVVVMESINARFMEAADFAEQPSFACVDVSFISLTKILPAVIKVLADADMSASGAVCAVGAIVTLIKPQFEAGRQHVEKGGVVRDHAVRLAVVENLKAFGTQELGLQWGGFCESPLKGPAGNVEFLAHWRMG